MLVVFELVWCGFICIEPCKYVLKHVNIYIQGEKERVHVFKIQAQPHC